MASSLQRKFLVFGATPVALLSIAGASAFTFGQDISQINGTQEQSNYLVVASNTTSTDNKWSETSYIGDSPALTSAAKTKDIHTAYGELPQWFQVNSGAIGVPSAVQEPGDLLFINAQSSSTSSADTDNGNLTPTSASRTNAVQAIHVKGNITNIAALRQTYATCLIPIRLYSTTNGGSSFSDVTQTYLDTQDRSAGTNGQTQSGTNPSAATTNPFYIDCTTGEFEFTVPTAAAVAETTLTTPGHSTADLAYEVTVERGGVFSTFNNNTGAQPEFVFQSTPLTYDPTNQFNTPGSTGNGQYTPNLKNS
jgi:hypothetical protein